VLAAGCALAGAVGFGWKSRGDDAGSKYPEGPYSPFKMGLQSWSLRGFVARDHPDLGKALASTKDFGLHYWECSGNHIPLTVDAGARDALKRQFDAAGVTLVGYGVVRLGTDGAANRRVFEFAKNMGLEYLTVDPSPGSFDDLDKLVEAFDIPIGIHNHGPGHRYALIDTISKAIKDHHPKIGCCIDAGHFLRSKQDPVDAVEAFGNRVYGVHLKDVKDAKTFTVLGQGDLRLVDFLKALAKNKYHYCLAIEYEEKPEDPIADIKVCLAEAAKAIAEVRKA